MAMGETVNLRRARKARDRARQRAQADENAARHGRTKAQLAADAAEAARRVRDEARLDGHRLTPAPSGDGNDH